MTSFKPVNSACARPTSRVVSRRLDDFSGFSEVFARWNGEFHQMSRGKFAGAIHVVNGEVVRLFQAETNQAILTRGMDSEFATFIPITVHNASTRWAHRRLSPGALIAKLPEAEYNNQTKPNTAIRALLMPVPAIQEISRILTGQNADRKLPTWSAPHPSPRAMERFERGLASLFATAIHTPSVLGTPEGRALEMECLRRLVEALPESSATVTVSLRNNDRTLLVRRAVDFMHNHLDGPLTAVELCAELGVSDRSLRRVFREAFGIGPLAYFRLIRLHAVAAALKAARGSDASVAEIAGHWGFQRLGSFAAEYKSQFGELPSHTLGVRGASGILRKAICLQ